MIDWHVASADSESVKPTVQASFLMTLVA